MVLHARAALGAARVLRVEFRPHGSLARSAVECSGSFTGVQSGPRSGQPCRPDHRDAKVIDRHGRSVFPVGCLQRSGDDSPPSGGRVGVHRGNVSTAARGADVVGGRGGFVSPSQVITPVYRRGILPNRGCESTPVGPEWVSRSGINSAPTVASRIPRAMSVPPLSDQRRSTDGRSTCFGPAIGRPSPLCRPHLEPAR